MFADKPGMNRHRLCVALLGFAAIDCHPTGIYPAAGTWAS